MKITRDQAQKLIDEHITTDWLKLHMRETEVIMRALAQKLGEDEDLWGLTGLLHDLDFDKIDIKDPKDHGTLTCEMLKDEFSEDVPEKMLNAIKSHVEELGHLGVKRETKLDYALSAAENLSGFLVACALVMPDKKIKSVKTKSVVKKLKQKSFAAKVNRQFIYDIEKADISLEELIDIALEELCKISDEIGL